MSKSISKKLTSFMLCMIFILAGLWIATDQSHAWMQTTMEPAPSHDWYKWDQKNKLGPGKGTMKTIKTCVPEVEVIGEAFVHGGNHKAEMSSSGIGLKVTVKSIAKNEANKGNIYIQGKLIDPGWIIYGNMQHLWNLHHSGLVGTIGGDVDDRIGWNTSGFTAGAQEFFAREGEKFGIVAYDEDWVYIWSDGFKSYDGINTGQCRAWVLLSSHPAGFYKISRDYVWMDIYSTNKIIENPTYKATAKVTRSTAPLYSQPGEPDSGLCYMTFINDVMYLPDGMKEVASVNPDDSHTYYKVCFRGVNDTNYMGSNVYELYIRAKYVNVQKNAVKKPEGAVEAVLTGIDTNKGIYVYSEKDTTTAINSYLQNGAEVYVYPDQSDDRWTAIWYDSKIGYINTKFVKYRASNLEIADIVDNQYVISWSKLPQACRVVIANKNGTIAAFNGVKANQMTIDESYFDKAYKTAYTDYLYVSVAADYGSDYEYVKLTLKKPAKGQRMSGDTSASNNTVSFNTQPSYVIQYATKSDFSNATTVKAAQSGKRTLIKGLKKNTQYYVRYYVEEKIETAAGTKIKKGSWSGTQKFKTKNFTAYKPTLKTVKSSKAKTLTLNWKKSNKGQLSGFEIMTATNKNFTKNKKTIKVANRQKTSWTIYKLKKGTKYFVKIRSYYKYGTYTYYSGWTNFKSVKVK